MMQMGFLMPWKVLLLEFFPSCGSAGKESACNVGDQGLIPGLGRSLGEENSYPLQYSGLENSMDYSPWGFKESDTIEWLSLHYEIEETQIIYIGNISNIIFKNKFLSALSVINIYILCWY